MEIKQIEAANRLLQVMEAYQVPDWYNVAESYEWVRIFDAAYKNERYFVQAGTRFYYNIMMNRDNPAKGKKVYNLIKPYIKLSTQGETNLLKFFKEKNLNEEPKTEFKPALTW